MIKIQNCLFIYLFYNNFSSLGIRPKLSYAYQSKVIPGLDKNYNA